MRVPDSAARRHEVLRRLEGRRTVASTPAAFARLRELVLTTPIGGRGPVDAGPGATTTDRELLRVCVAVLSRYCELDGTAAPASTAPTPRARRRARRRGSAPVVVGSSPGAAALRWRTSGVRVTGPPVVLVVAAPLDAMAAGLWRERVEAGAGVRWRRLWAGFVARDRLPDALDPVVSARRWRERTTPDRVRVLAGDAGHRLPDVLGEVTRAALPDRLGAVDTDLLRRLNQALATRPEPIRRRPYDGALRERFDAPWDGAPGVPDESLDWALARGERMAVDLAGCGVEVHGEPRLVVPSSGARLRKVPVADTLERALAVLSSQFEGGDPWRPR